MRSFTRWGCEALRRSPGALMIALALACIGSGLTAMRQPQPAVASPRAWVWALPSHVPPPRVPEWNPMTPEKFELGRYLFYDARLSGNGRQSCATCHQQRLAFTDGRPQSIGSTGEIHPRNAQSLANVAWFSTLTWANPLLTEIEKQIPIPMFGEFPVELGITGKEQEVLDRFRADPQYRRMFAAAFPGEAEPITWKNIVYALATFTRGLTSFDSPYDRYLAGDQAALTPSAIRGMQMFFSEDLECHHCHTGFNLSASTTFSGAVFIERPFFNTGLYNIDGKGAYPPDNEGVKELTNDPTDMGRFRPPSLRNVALTAPYMHDGSIATLEEVIRFYERGGRKITSGPYAGDGRLSPLKNGLVSGFTLTDAQRQDLIAFLESLTDWHFVTNPRFSDPFAPAPAAQATPAPRPAATPIAVAPSPTPPPIFSQQEYRTRLNAILTDLNALRTLVRRSHRAEAQRLAQQVHDRLHALRATSHHLGVGDAHDRAEAHLHGQVLARLTSEDARPAAIIVAIRDLQALLRAMARAAG
ncbi:methanobactin export MATE transporter MbnM [Candidatus Roseilinea sp. NK_OTU-006]|jgi:cytochrome c peroxidase|uniref:methanobactin export MATE transporter MbnM n=1 Tax=Candidatus Roseilinea sp. NK_OTU-006 TaxID=2704250 RepID=UPI00145D94DB|nr:methanobactin export MATE transporter MbnM [Candidatus Roseilinea sp. NK_OTU-006]